MPKPVGCDLSVGIPEARLEWILENQLLPEGDDFPPSDSFDFVAAQVEDLSAGVLTVSEGNYEVRKKF